MGKGEPNGSTILTRIFFSPRCRLGHNREGDWGSIGMETGSINYWTYCRINRIVYYSITLSWMRLYFYPFDFTPTPSPLCYITGSKVLYNLLFYF